MVAETVFAAVLAVYVAALLWFALRVEKTPGLRRKVASSPYVYTLSLTVYMTAWTFYGNVGQAAQSGMAFLVSFIGTFFGVAVWWWVLRRMIRLKSRYRITSIADFFSARYGKSHFIAGVVALFSVLGSLPYVAIQFKAILATLGIMLAAHGTADSAVDAGAGLFGQSLPHVSYVPYVPWEQAVLQVQGSLAGPALLGFSILFTILAGVRRLDPTERHQGVVAVIAVESVVKIAAFMAAGIFVTYGMYNGFGDIFTRSVEAGYASLLSPGRIEGGYMEWVMRAFLFAPAVLLLPRQFHLAVVENSDERHVRTAMWLLPLYMLLITVFVMPMALAGLLQGYDAAHGDWFVLLLPLQQGMDWLSLLVFLGGFSAGMSMIVIATMTMTTMLTNDLLLPVLNLLPRMAWLRRYILQCRWAVVCAYLSMGYGVFLMVGESYTLVSLGIVSMMAFAQLGPAAVGGLFWTTGNRAGAVSGLLAGFGLWFYTQCVPVLIRSGVLESSMLETGPFGIGWLRPEQLLGLEVFSPLAHTLFWSILMNVLCYVVGSCLWTPRERDVASAREFISVMEADREMVRDSERFERTIPLAGKYAALSSLFSEYYGPSLAERIVGGAVQAVGLQGVSHISVVELATLSGEAERRLAGMVGSASASKIIRSSNLFTEAEREELAAAYKTMLASLHISPEELLKRLDYYKEREVLLQSHAQELGAANEALRAQIFQREQAQRDLQAAEERYRSIFENAVEGIFQTRPEGSIVHGNTAAARILGYDSVDELIRGVRDIRGELYVDGDDRDRFLSLLRENGEVSHFETRLRRKDGSAVWVALHSRAIFDAGGKLALIEGILEDISDRKRAEEEMHRANRFVRSIIDAMPSVMVAVTLNRDIVHWNREAELRYGMSKDEVSGRSLFSLLPWLVSLDDTIGDAFQSGETRRKQRLQEVRDGEEHILDVVIYPLEAQDGSRLVVLRLDDATSRVRMEEMMVQTEKMMSVGGLAAGMAHEINNPLGAILIGVQNILRRVEPSRPANQQVAGRVGVSLDQMNAYLEERKVLEMLRGVRSAGERAASIVSNMLEFSRRSETKFARVSVSSLLDKAVELARNDYDLKKKYDFRQVEIVREYDPGAPDVFCNSTEIEQVLLNLLRNAAQAMYTAGADRPRPKITLRTLCEGDRVRIEVADNGPGMDESVRRRVFEPFFTTKPVGVGTGLGLSVSYFIITTNHGGQFFVDARKEQGTTFTILLPTRPEAEAEGRGQAEVPQSP